MLSCKNDYLPTLLFFLLLLVFKGVIPRRTDVRSSCDARDLGTKIVRLVTREWRVADDLNNNTLVSYEFFEGLRGEQQ